MTSTSMKQCVSCGDSKPLSTFVKCSRCKDGIGPKCRACQRAYQKAYRAKPGVLKHTNLLSNYGITLDQYEALIEHQGNKCPICLDPLNVDTPRDVHLVHLDHCHDTGHIRGVLCKHCNHGLGRFKDNKAALQRAISYLSTRKSPI